MEAADVDWGVIAARADKTRLHLLYLELLLY